MAIEDATEHTERYCQIRNNQLKLQWELKFQKIIEAGILCSERRRHYVTRSVSPFSTSALEQKDDVF